MKTNVVCLLTACLAALATPVAAYEKASFAPDALYRARQDRMVERLACVQFDDRCKTDADCCSKHCRDVAGYRACTPD